MLKLTIQLLLQLSLIGMPVMSVAQTFSTEVDLKERYTTTIKAFWDTGRFESFQGVDNARINYASFTANEHEKCIILVPGRSEGYLKYKELSSELFAFGYDVHIIDHRGQGISQRLTENPHKGYVKSFDDYSTDLAQFVDTIVQPKCKKTFLLAHSMGGAIASRYMQLHKNNLQAAVLASPMIAINGGGIPPWLASFLINSGDSINQLFSEQPWYFLGQGDHSYTSFEENRLTQSSTRYEILNGLYEQTTELQLGGVTFHWLAQALNANINIFEDISQLSVPTLVLQAGADSIVDNEAQNQFCQALNATHSLSCPEGKPLLIPGAQHELFFEQDVYRNQAMEQVLNWFKQYD